MLAHSASLGRFVPHQDVVYGICRGLPSGCWLCLQCECMSTKIPSITEECVSQNRRIRVSKHAFKIITSSILAEWSKAQM